VEAIEVDEAHAAEVTVGRRSVQRMAIGLPSRDGSDRHGETRRGRAFESRAPDSELNRAEVRCGARTLSRNPFSE
jgi:hypothetical protein